MERPESGRVVGEDNGTTKPPVLGRRRRRSDGNLAAARGVEDSGRVVGEDNGTTKPPVLGRRRRPDHAGRVGGRGGRERVGSGRKVAWLTSIDEKQRRSTNQNSVATSDRRERRGESPVSRAGERPPCFRERADPCHTIDRMRPESPPRLPPRLSHAIHRRPSACHGSPR